jgi:hypothetical protein
MASQALLRQIAQLRAEVQALKERKDAVVSPALTLDTIRETLRVLLDIKAIELDGMTMNWKRRQEEFGDGDDGEG